MKKFDLTEKIFAEHKERTVFFFILAVFFLLIIRLGYLQIFRSEYYYNLSERNRIRVLPTPSARGRIFDRNNIVLVDNSPTYTISIMPFEFPADSELVDKLSALLDVPSDYIWEKYLKTNFSTDGPCCINCFGFCFHFYAKSWIDTSTGSLRGEACPNFVSKDELIKIFQTQTGSVCFHTLPDDILKFALIYDKGYVLWFYRSLEDKVREKSRKLKEAQEQLIQSEKLTSLGKMAAGVAHEINNPLTSILINSHLIAEKLKDDDRFQENLNLMINETTRCSEIVKGLLEFSRQTPLEKNPADINEVIEKTLLLLKSQLLVHNVKVAKELDGNLPKIMMDINKIEQVFTNIILNAIEAMPDGGILFVSSRHSADNRFVEIEFRDEGCGIPKENINRIFDPFFTTKGNKGTGLGLSISYGIVRQHSGTIDVQSELAKGTSITIHLPIKDTKKIQVKGVGEMLWIEKKGGHR